MQRISLVLLLLSVIPTQEIVAARVSARVSQLLELRIVPAYRSHDLFAAKAVVAGLVEKLSDDHLSAADEFLASKKVPPLTELLLQLRETEVVAFDRTPTLGAREAMRVLPLLEQQIRARLDDNSQLKSQTQARDKRLSANEALRAYRQKLWDLHVAKQRLVNAQRLADFGALASRRQHLSESSFASQATDLAECLSQLEENEAVVRVAAVSLATDVLRESRVFRERLRAAYVVDFDGQQLVEYLRTLTTERRGERRFRRNSQNSIGLAAPKTLAAIQAATEYARETAGDLTEKSRLLFSGMAWWMRGRYGAGAKASGSLKPTATIDEDPPQQVHLFMPILNQESNQHPQPRFARRHHVIWMVNADQMQSLPVQRGPGDQRRAVYCEAIEIPQMAIAGVDGVAATRDRNGDRSRVLPLVGYFEYGMALRQFDQLLARLTDAERTAISNFIAEHTALSVRAMVPNKSSNAEMEIAATQPETRRGLDWVMALARIEFASMLATFTGTTDPFVTVKPSQYELPAYKELLGEGVRMHHAAMLNDPAVRSLSSLDSDDPKLQAYSRRLGLTRKMLRAYAKSGVGDLSPREFRKLATWKRDLDLIHADLLTGVRRQLGGFENSWPSH